MEKNTHDVHDIARNHTIKLRYHTIFTIPNGVLKTQRDNFFFELFLYTKALHQQSFLLLQNGSICKELSRPIYFLEYLWYNYFG